MANEDHVRGEKNYLDRQVFESGTDHRGSEVEGVGTVYMDERSDTPTDDEQADGQTALYAKADGNVYKRPHGGEESEIGSGGGGGGLQPPGSSTDPDLGFDEWRTPNENRTVHVIVGVSAQTNGMFPGVISFLIDEDGGETQDYQFQVGANPGLGTGGQATENFSMPLRPGSSYQIENSSDPSDGGNSIQAHREFVL